MVQNVSEVMQLFRETQQLSPRGPFPRNNEKSAQLIIVELGLVQQCAEVFGEIQALSMHYAKEGVVHWFPGLGLRALRPSTVLLARREDVDKLTTDSAQAATRLRFAAQRQEELAREWLHNLSKQGERPLAHFICEQSVRVGKVALPAIAFRLPSQTEVADALACTRVHVSRMLSRLENAGLITSQGPYITILDWERLQQLGRFNDRYLRP